MYTNADQPTPSKIFELRKFLTQNRPCILAVCEMKPKKQRNDRTPYADLDVRQN